MKNVLVVGGAGYIGSNMVAYLLDKGEYSVTVLDDLSTGHRELVLVDDYVNARAGNTSALHRLFARKKFDCVMHFAAKALVAESVEKPALYFENNVTQTQVLLDAMLEHGVSRFIFSSTCAIYGNPGDADISEDLPKAPVNPYGETKLKAEAVMQDLARSRGLKAVALRYFNAAGADKKLRAGEWHEPETHLIPKIFEAANTNSEVQIFGTDYPTPDGTCVRDYIHIWDLARAHELAMLRLLDSPGSDGRFEAFNLGSGTGFSVREMIRECELITGKKINCVERDRRPGDPPRLVANSSLALKELGWKTREDSLKWILETAWAWEQKLLKLKATYKSDSNNR